MLTGVALVFVEFFVTKILEKLFSDLWQVRTNRQKLEQKVKAATEEALLEAVEPFPDYNYMFENFDFAGYLERPLVSSELQKIFNGRGTPKVEVLSEEWIKHSGIQNTRNIPIILRIFIYGLRDKLSLLPELQGYFHTIDTKEIHAYATLIPGIDKKVEELFSYIQDSDQGNDDSPFHEVNTLINSCKDLSKRGFPNACLIQLVEIEKLASTKSIPNQILAKILTLRGGCYLQLARVDEAMELFKRAYAIDPHNPDILANYALFLLVANEIEKSIEVANESLRIKPHDNNAKLVLIEAQARQKNYMGLQDLIDDEYLNNKSYLCILGYLFEIAGDLENSAKHLRLCLAIDENNIQARVALAGVLAEKVRPSHFFKSISAIELLQKEELQESLSLIEEALTLSKNKDNPIQVQNIIASRAGIRGILGDDDGAKNDCEQVLQENPDHILAIHNRAIIAASERDFENFVNIIDRLPCDYLRENKLIIPLITGLIELRHYERAELEINKYMPSIHVKETLDFLVISAWLFIKQGEQEKVTNIISGLENDWPQNSDVYESIGLIYRLNHDFAKMIENWERAFDIAESPVDRQRISVELIDAYYEDQSFTDVIRCVERSGLRILSNIRLARQYTGALYSIREYGKAYSFVRDARESGKQDITLLEFESWLSEYLGNLSEAARIQNLLVDIDPSNPKNKLELARLEFRLENHDKAKTLLGSINIEELENPIDLIQIAELYSLQGEHEKALIVAYKARSRGINIAEVHSAYINLFMRAAKIIAFERDTVVVNSAIKLNNNSETRWVKILTNIQLNEENWEFSENSPIATKLLGRRIGEWINFREGPVEMLSFQIIEIQSIFVRAFQETFDQFSARFPDNLNLQKIHIVDQDFTEFFRFIIRLENITEKFQKLFSSGQLSLEQFSILAGKDAISIFLALQHSTKEKIFASVGTHKDQQEQEEIVRDSKKISLSLTAIMSIKYLDLFDVLSARFEEIYVTQRLIDQITKKLLDLDFDKAQGGGKSIRYENQNFFIDEISIDTIDFLIDYFEDILSFVNKRCTVLPIRPELSSHLHQGNSFSSFPGNVSITSILIALGYDLPLYCDDIALQRIASGLYKVRCFWTQDFLRDLLNKDLIEQTRYSEACAKLALAGYLFLSLNDITIFRIIELDNFTISPRVDAMLSTFKGPDALEDECIEFCGSLIRRIWLAIIPTAQRLLFLYRILDYLTTERPLDRVLSKFVRTVEIKLALAPFQQYEVNQEIMQWRTQHAPQGNLTFGTRDDVR